MPRATVLMKCFIGCFVLLLYTLGAALPSAAEPLFRLGARADTPAVRGASEERLLDLDLAALTTKAAHLDMTLAPGEVHRALLVEVEERAPGRFAWRGRIAAPDDSAQLVNVTLTVHDGLLFGALTLPSGTWVIQPVKEGGHRLAKIDESLLPACGGGLAPDEPMKEDLLALPHDKPTSADASAAGEEKAIAFVSVLGLYTPAARAGAGSRGAMEGTLQSAIDSTNTSFINSQVRARVVLRHVTEFSLVPERGDIIASLAQLRTNSAVAALRNQWSADLVAAVYERDQNVCGVAYAMRNPGRGFAPWAFSTNLRVCIASRFTLAHEIGHNLGLEHNPGNSSATPGTASYPWSFGHFIDGKYRTIMSYSRPCTQGCPRRLYYSNPAVQTLGEPTGIVNQRDSHRSLNLTTPIAARFRDVVLQADFEVVQGSPRRDGPVEFLNTSTGAPTEVHWDFGDGSASTEESPTHTYSQVGTYTVQLEVRKGSQSKTTSQEVTVLDNLCLPGPTTLCLGADGRFEATVSWQNFESESGQGTVVASDAEDSGLLWFFDADNWELLLKVVDGCGFNGQYWVFSAATTNVEYTLQVTDTRSGHVRSYFNPLGNAAAALTDIEAFATCDLAAAEFPEDGTEALLGPAGSAGVSPALGRAEGHLPTLSMAQRATVPGSCEDGDLCLEGERFRVEVDWADFEGNTGLGTPAVLRSDGSGLLWFFNENNWEMLVKVVNGCGFNDHFWVFSAATTNLAYTLKVTDLETGMVREYKNELGNAAAALTDTEAFATCL